MGKCEDIYYPSEELTKKQCHRTTQNTRYVQSLTQLSGGTSVFIIPPGQLLQDVVLSLQLPDLTGANTGLALSQGWGYALIKQISYRVGGSSQYYVSGAQMLQHALKRMPNTTARGDLLAYGGQQLVGAQLAGTANYAYIWMDLPWTTATAEGKPPGVPSDILSTQTQVTVELYGINTIFSINGVAPSVPPTALASGQFQIQQVQLENSADSFGRRYDMATHSLNVPVEFIQQEVAIPLPGVIGTTGVVPVTLTGFRSGSVKSLEIWLTRAGDSSGVTKNPLKWYAPLFVQSTYAGNVYSRFDAGSSAVWALINAKASPYVPTSTLGYAGGAYTSTGYNSAWVSLPFSQTFSSPESSSYMLTEGLQVTNGIVNLQVQVPNIDATADYTLHCSYVYASTMVFSQSTCEFAF